MISIKSRKSKKITGNTINEILENDIPQTWEEFFSENKRLLSHISDEIGTIDIPLPIDVFEAYHLTPLIRVRVVIIGQDPYPTRSQSTGLPNAKGLAFSYSKTDGSSPSMHNVIKELRSSYSDIVINHTCLTSWALQGVFLLNTALTFKKKNDSSENEDIKKWIDFIILTLKEVLKHNPDCIFVAWGAKAKDLLKKVGNIKHLLFAGHPSPLNTKIPFIGCGHFKKINEILTEGHQTAIDWNLY